MPTHTSTAAGIVLDAPPSSHGTRLITGATAGLWARIAERDGTPVVDLDLCNLGDLREPFGKRHTFEWDVPRSLSAIIDECTLVEREVQVWLGGELRMAGPILTRSVGDGDGPVSFGATDCLFYFERLLRGGWQPWSRNYLQNFRFDDDFNRWDVTGTVDLDATHVTSGVQAAMIDDVPTASVAQTVRIDLAIRYSVVIDFKVWVEASVTTGRGLEVSVPGVQGGDSFGVHRIDASTARDTWTTLRVVLEVEGRVGARSLTAALFGADGGKVWLAEAAVTIFPISSIAEEVEGAQVATQVDIATVLSDAIQATNSGLNIGVDAPLTGELVDYKPADDVDVYVSEIIRRLTERDPGIDVFMAYGAGGSVRTVTSRFPRMGTDHLPDDLTLTLHDPTTGAGNVTGYRIGFDATKATNEVTTIGEGDYRGTSLNEDSFGGVRLQTVQTAPPKTPLGDLEGMSRKKLRLTAGDVETLEVDCLASVTPLIHKGDRVLATIADDSVAINEVYRIIDITIDGPTGACSLNLNVEPA